MTNQVVRYIKCHSESCSSNGTRVKKRLVGRIEHIPSLIMFESCTVHPTPEADISISTDSGPVHMRLCGFIYTGESHFNSRVFEQNGSVWKHDGMIDRGNVNMKN